MMGEGSESLRGRSFSQARQRSAAWPRRGPRRALLFVLRSHPRCPACAATALGAATLCGETIVAVTQVPTAVVPAQGDRRHCQPRSPPPFLPRHEIEKPVFAVISACVHSCPTTRCGQWRRRRTHSGDRVGPMRPRRRPWPWYGMR